MNNDIGECIKYYRETYHMTQTKLAEKIGVSQRNISYYESGDRIPPVDVLKKIASIFNVSVDYILGIEKSNGNDYSNFMLTDDRFDFKERVRNLLAEESMSEEEFMIKTGFDASLKDDYLYGNRSPSIEDLIKIAGALRVSTDYLLDMSQRKRISAEDELLIQTITPRERNLLNTYRQLNEDNQDIVVGKVKDLFREQSLTESPITAEEIRKASGK